MHPLRRLRAEERKVFWRTFAVSIVAVWGTSLSTQAVCAELTDLPPDQHQTASCMLSVVSGLRGVTDPKLRLSAVPGPTVSAEASIHTFLDYTYHHRSDGVSPRVSPEEIEITEIIASKKGSLLLGGMTSEAAPDLDDNDLGMIRITDGWQRMCGLTLIVFTG